MWQISVRMVERPGHPHGKGGAPDRIRTCGLCLRRAALYPAELRVPGRERLAKPARRRQCFYFATLTGWNVPSPHVAPRMPLDCSTVIVSTEHNSPLVTE